MRGGTNQFHGSAYEFNQVSKLAATPWFTNNELDAKSNRVAGSSP